MNKFKLVSDFKPIADQKKAIEKLSIGLKNSIKYQVLLGTTGSGKTFTIANLIDKLQIPTLIISHNKTLAAQLYQEFRDFFPTNAVSYFVSYYDYYQPEAYIPSTDTYIEKDADINEMIDKLRLSATTNLLTRKDVIVVASVSSIYNIGSPDDYAKHIYTFSKGDRVDKKHVSERLVDLQYEKTEYGFVRSTFRIRGENIDIYPAYSEYAIRIFLKNDKVFQVIKINPLTGKEIEKLSTFTLYPAKHYIADPDKNMPVFDQIRKDMNERFDYFKSKGKLLEANRIKQKVTYDLEMLQEVGYVKGIENYSRYFDKRQPGDPPNSLLEFFKRSFSNNWLVVVDESHITFPQIRGMYAGDLSRKQTLIDYGFRLPAALDNRPLTFDEFIRKIPNFIATSATPSDWEKDISISEFQTKKNNLPQKSYKSPIIEQLIRPTGIPDPLIDIRPTNTQVVDVLKEIKKRVKIGQRTLITSLTKRSAEDLSKYLSEKGIKVHYIHSDVDTLERTDILDDLRRGKFDAIVGVNLLREGLDLPEVSLVAILDADKEGFLRSRVSLIQTMGRAARHSQGEVILYADTLTGSIKAAIDEVERRRSLQIEYNKVHNITPKTIKKPLRERLVEEDEKNELENLISKGKQEKSKLLEIDNSSLTPLDKKRLLPRLKREMRSAAENLNFEFAAEIRDKIYELSK